MADIFEKIQANRGPIGVHAKESHGYFTFPKLEGDIGPHMNFRGKRKLNWSLNNYLGLANHPEVRKADADAGMDFGFAMPMGARMMSGNSNLHEQLEHELADYVSKEDSILVNFGYQAMVSAIDCLVDRHDVIVYDAESHACILDGVRLHMGKRYVFKHNDVGDCEKQLERATKLAQETGGAILVITEGVFGMRGDQGCLKEIVALKKKFNFRLFVDDAHGVGTLGATGAGTGEEQGVQDEIDVYFGTFAKSFAMIGGFIASEAQVVEYLRYNMRSQIFAKAMPMTLVAGALKRLELIRKNPVFKTRLWEITNALQTGLKDAGFEIGPTNSCVTPVYLNGSIPESTNLIYDLRENYNIFCSMVVYPVVPKGMIILRLIPTAVHTMEDVSYTIESFSKIVGKLKSGEYMSETIARV
ncbi:MAG: aminotransferase class I/II-fold pyridoxal phosphate-dependent enzyme [Bacteroidetes bacterium]|nr:aminotransferase class I/II-fold pyridoxal phosphate-dependent enzyme [Bacteroidota bacterium]MBM3424462.1 aminotransferase class I/II-fold pyridoxal phosphate-dependent enzyme [Bacteroidota bacterium]